MKTINLTYIQLTEILAGDNKKSCYSSSQKYVPIDKPSLFSVVMHDLGQVDQLAC